MPHARHGSGTAWEPDASPLRAHHFMLGGWMLMLHGSASLGWDEQGSDRGGHRLVSTNWIMAGATHRALGGEIQLRAMLSAEPFTIPGRGFPLLLQTGEFYDGVHLHDAQHPHDLFMEASATLRIPLSKQLGFEIYAAPVGEPAVGPVAFMHRASAVNDPLPPISHHWQDSTHVSFGVVTAGLFTRGMKLEASYFNGREPDQDRTDFELRKFDSFSFRLSANPTDELSAQVSYAYLPSPEPPNFPGVVADVSRATASLLYSNGRVDAALIWGRNLEVTPLDSVLFEANADLDGRNAPFVRLEWVRKTAHDLVVPGVSTFDTFSLWGATLGFVHAFEVGGPVTPVLGARGSIGSIPEDLKTLYGTRTLLGGMIYLLLRAPRSHH